MRTFACARCDQLVFFENTECLSCGAGLGFRWADRELITLTDEFVGPPRCANAEVANCNAFVDAEGELCASCVLTTTRPADAQPEELEKFARAEAAKRRLLFELGELGLPVPSRREDPEGGLAFDLLSSRKAPVTTGHADGLITLDLAESDPAHREQMRVQMGEPYRTLLGHFRHEVGHFYFPLLAPEGSPEVDRCRALFGDDREDYGAAMDRHYAEGAPEDWAERHVSAYATMHPYEDWAETFAHYLHIRDTAQTAVSYGVRVAGPSPPRRVAADAAALDFVPLERRQSMRELLADWIPLTYALNALNRSMGADDLYPFVLPEPVVEKLELVDELVLAKAGAAAA
ncbi:MAG: hypothetical protein JWO90_1659 [Solirubrobacterales bacterium]|jgi:hypothetical protein|nr:hypothetical protein [Solirubrobacterales bacterium]